MRMTAAMQQEESSSPAPETPSLDLEIIPAMYEHAVRVYGAMAEKAKPDDDGLLVYDGHLTGLFRMLRLSIPYYTTIKNRLIAMGCIEQLRRGGGSGTSRWVLWKTPELEEWRSVAPARAQRGSKTAQQDQAIRSLAERVTTLEAQMALMIERLG
jgi:hypothetical protein